MSPCTLHAADSRGGKRDNNSRPGTEQPRTAAQFPERRERDHGRAIFLNGSFVSTRTVGGAALNSETGSIPEARPSAFRFHPRVSSRAVRARVLRGFLLPAFRLWRTQFVRAVKVARHLFFRLPRSLALQACKQSARCCSEGFHLNLSALAGLVATADGHSISQRKSENVRQVGEKIHV